MSITGRVTVTPGPGEGLYRVTSRHGVQDWATTRPVRTRHTCVNCGATIAPGERAARPIKNTVNRHERLCQACTSACDALTTRRRR